MSRFKKTILIISIFIVLVLIFSQQTLGIRILFPSWLVGTLRDFLADESHLSIEPYKNGTIILIKPVATGVGDGRYEAGDIVEIRDGWELYQRFGPDYPFLGYEERTRLLPVYYDGKLTEEMKKRLVAPEKEPQQAEESRNPDLGQDDNKLLKRRQYGLDYTQILSDRQILKVRNFQKLDKLPEVDLSNIIQKTADQASAVKVPRYLSEIEKARNQLKRIAQAIIPPIRAQSESVKTVDTGGFTDYSSLNAWEGGEEKNLVTAQEIAVAKCRHATATSTADTTPPVIGGGWETDATHYIKIWTDPDEGYRHNGVWDENKYRIEYALGSGDGGIDVQENYVRIFGIQIRDTGGADGIGIKINTNISGTVIFGYNIIRGTGEYGIGPGMADNSVAKIYNNIIYDSNSGISLDSSNTDTLYAFNNTVVDSTTGFYQWGGSATFIAKNNIAYDNTDNYDGTFDTTNSTNNLGGPDSQGDVPGASGRDGVGVLFTDENATNRDLRLAYADTGAKGYGVDLSTSTDITFSDDIDGQTRPLNSWDIGADQYQATEIYRSVGPSNNSSLASGAGNNLTISGGIATFASPLPQNVGVGDAIQYDSDDSGSVDAIVFIHQRHSPTHFTVRDANGFITASSTRVADQNWDVYRAYDSLSNAEAGSENSGLNDTVQYFEDWTNGKDLASSTERWNIACYADAADTTAVEITGWDTAADNYIKIYTPVSQSEVGVSQRHSGKWDDGNYRLDITAGDVLKIYEDFTKIDGLQLKVISSASNLSIISSVNLNSVASIEISNNIVTGSPSGSATDWIGISADYYESGSSSRTWKVWNNIIYGLTGAGGSHKGIKANSGSSVGSEYFYNNTIYGCTQGIQGTNDVTVIKNNLVYGNGDNYYNYFEASSDYNLSGPGTDSDMPGSNSRDGVGVLFADEANDDFHLGLADTGARNAGTDLSSDANLAFSDDIDGEERPGGGGGWDIGADELKSTTLLNAPITNFLTDGLVGHWTFNGEDMDWATNTAYDRSGEGNNGEITNMTTSTAPVIGKVGQALDFDGSDDYVNCGNNSSLQFGAGVDFTISAWIQTTVTGTGWRGIVDKHWAASWAFYLTDNLDYIGFSINGNYSYERSGATAIADGKWHHVAVVADRDSVATFYLDGAVDGATHDISAQSGVNLNSNSVLLGKHQETENYFPGYIDEARIYNRALTADEVAQLYRASAKTFQVNTPITQKYTSGLVGHWTFNGQDMTGAPVSAGGNLLRESFESSGYENTWTEDRDAGCTCNEDSSIPGSAPTGAGSQSLQLLFRDDGKVNTRHDPGSEQTTTYFRGYAYIDAEGLFDTDECGVFFADEDGWNTVWRIKLYQASGTLYWRLKLYNNGAEQTQDVAFGSLDTWYRWEVKYNNSDNTYEFRLDGSDQWSGSLTGTHYTGVRRVYCGAEVIPWADMDIYTDLVALDDSDWVGEEMVATDRSGQSNHGNVLFGTKPAIGQIGQALEFDGSDDYVMSTAKLPFTEKSASTISLWMYPRAAGGTLIEYEGDNTLSSSYTQNSIGYIASGALKFEVYTTGLDGIASTPAQAAINTWHHVVGVLSGSEMRLYIDGISVASSGTTFNDLNSDNNDYVALGAGTNNWQDFSGTYFNGTIDEVRIYNRALSADEVGELYRVGARRFKLK